MATTRVWSRAGALCSVCHGQVPAEAGNRKRGTRGVFERPRRSGVWWVRYADENGRIHREKVGPKGLALKVYQERKNEIAERRFFPEQIRRREALFSDFVGDYLARIKGRIRSYADYQRYGENWKGVLKGKTIRQVSQRT